MQAPGRVAASRRQHKEHLCARRQLPLGSVPASQLGHVQGLHPAHALAAKSALTIRLGRGQRAFFVH